MPEYLKKRFGGTRLQLYLTVMTLFLYIFTKISSDLYAGYVFIDQALGLNIYIAVIILLIVSALFTILGGLTAVLWTDFVQTILMIIGAIILMITSFIKVGGFEQMLQNYYNAVPNTTRYSISSSPIDPNMTYVQCGAPDKEAMHFQRSPSDDKLPWTGIVFGLTISHIWCWCTDQVIVQRTLSAKNLSNAKAGCVLAGLLKLLPLWLMVFPGMIARVLFPDLVACGQPDVCMEICGKARGCTDIAYPVLALRLLPQGLRGLMLAVMMASLVSSLTSIFNSSSTLFTMDVWLRFRPRAKTTELMIVGRLSTVIIVALSVAWLPVVRSGGELWHYIQSVTSYLAPPVCVVFLLAVFWPRCNEKGASASMLVGLIVGMTRFIWESIYSRPLCGEQTSLAPGQSIITSVHYLHFSVILFAICISTAVCVSLVTQPLPDKHIKGLTYWTRWEKNESDQENDSTKDNSKANLISNSTVCNNRLEVQDEAIIDDQSTNSKPWYTRLAYWVCGVEQQSTDTPAVAVNISIEEKPTTALLTDSFAALLLFCVALVWGFFA